MYRILTIGMLPGINGIATSAMNLYRHLDRDLIQWDFLMRKEFLNGHHKSWLMTFEEEIRDLGGRVWYADYSRTDTPPYTRKIIKRRLTEDPAIMGVHVHDVGNNIYPLWAADQLGKPVKVIQFHSACPRSQAEEILQHRSRRLKTRFRMISGDQFDRFACSDLGGLTGFGELPFEVLPNGTELEKFAYNPVFRQVIRASMGIEEDAPVIGFAGMLYEVKQPLFVLQVFEQFLKLESKAHLIMLGSGPDLQEACNYCKEHHLMGRAHLLGLQRGMDLFYSVMDLLLCPSQREGFPNVLVEAQCAGVSCLVSDEITDMVCLTPLVQQYSLKKDAAQWAKKLKQMFHSLPPRHSWDQQLREAGYDIKTVVSRLTDRYLKRIEAWSRENV